MKKALPYFIYEIYKNINPIWRRRILYFLGTLTFLVLLSGALVFYAGYKTIYFALTQINNETALIQNTETLLNKGQKSLQKAQKNFNVQACLQELQASTNLTYWVQKPIFSQIQDSWKKCNSTTQVEPAEPATTPQNEPNAPADWN